MIVAGAESVITTNAVNISTEKICVADFVSIITFIIYKYLKPKKKRKIKNYAIFMILASMKVNHAEKVKLHEIIC